MRRILRLDAVPPAVSQIFSTRRDTVKRLPAYRSISGMNGTASRESSPSKLARISAAERTSTTSPGRKLRRRIASIARNHALGVGRRQITVRGPLEPSHFASVAQCS